MKLKVLSIVFFFICGSVIFAQWRQSDSISRKYRPNGDRIIGTKGVILGKYDFCKFKVGTSSDKKDLVVNVERVRAEWDSRIECQEPVYLFCMFFKKDPRLTELTNQERRDLFIPDCEQGWHKIKGKSSIYIKVPSSVRFVMFTLCDRRATIEDMLNKNAYWEEKLLLEVCGVAPAGSRFAESSVIR